ncbi:hypothetical protein Avbf_00970 [Armadillidium vulgare]|nr:hypothetical protein Avbf_00970 [Armadillidium vulgare]
MDIKSEVEIKDELLVTSEYVQDNGQIFEQEVQKEKLYPSIVIKEESEIKDEELDIKEEYAEDGHHIKQIFVLEDSQVLIAMFCY